MQRMATTRYLFGRARCGVQGNNVAINHLFTRMFKVNCYIHPNDRLNLTNAPIGPIRMDHKITKAEIKQLRISYGFFHEKRSKAPRLLAMIGWRLASPFDASKLKPRHSQIRRHRTSYLVLRDRQAWVTASLLFQAPDNRAFCEGHSLSPKPYQRSGLRRHFQQVCAAACI